MLDLFAYCPNAPPCMMTPPPSERHVTGYTEQQVREMLPSPELVDNFIGDVMMLTGNDIPASVSSHVLSGHRQTYCNISRNAFLFIGLCLWDSGYCIQ